MNPRHYKPAVALATQRVSCRRYLAYPPKDRTREFIALNLYWARCWRLCGWYESARRDIMMARQLRLEAKRGEFPEWLGTDEEFFSEFTEIEG